MVTRTIPLDTLDAAEERAAANEWGQAVIALPKPAMASSHWYHFLAVELFPDGYSYTDVVNPTGERRYERLLTRDEALHLVGCGPLCPQHGDVRDTSLAGVPI